MVKREQATRKNGWTAVAAGATVSAIAVAGMAMGVGDGREDDLFGPIRLQDAEALSQTSTFEVQPDYDYSIVPAPVIDLRPGDGFASPLDDQASPQGGTAVVEATAAIGTDSPSRSATSVDSVDDAAPATDDGDKSVASAASVDDAAASVDDIDDAGASVASADSPEQVVEPAASADSPEQWVEPAASAESGDDWSGSVDSGGSAGSYDSD